jgi:hypothetical protein
MTVRERPEAALPHRFCKEAQPEDRFAGFVGDFYLPLRVIFQIAGNIPRHVGKHAPGLSPRRVIIREVRRSARLR